MLEELYKVSIVVELHWVRLKERETIQILSNILLSLMILQFYSFNASVPATAKATCFWVVSPGLRINKRINEFD